MTSHEGTPVVHEPQLQRAERSGLSGTTAIDVALIGHTGQVGHSLLTRLQTGPGRKAGLQVAELLNRTRHRIARGRDVSESQATAQSLADLAERLGRGGRPAVIVDCTADAEIPARYPDWLARGIGVVTPNKHGLAGDRLLYERIQAAAWQARTPLAYSATVGAGLPILDTLRRLRRAGEMPLGISAVLSGTLVHVFNRLAAGWPLSKAVLDARRQGYTEPNPLEDLSGRDVQRKLIIMLREAGLKDLPVERDPVVPDDMAAGVSRDGEIIALLESLDRRWQHRVVRAAARDRVWCYVARFDGERAWVRPEPVSQHSALAGLFGAGNLASIELAADEETPVVIRGPGAGIAVTATAVMADLAQAAVKLEIQAFQDGEFRT